MKKYTLTSYDPVELDLPKPQVPASLVDAQIEKLLEPMAEYHEIAEERGVAKMCIRDSRLPICTRGVPFTSSSSNM